MSVQYDQVKIVKEKPYLISYSRNEYSVKIRVHVFLFFYKWVTIYSFCKYPSDVLTQRFIDELLNSINKL